MATKRVKQPRCIDPVIGKKIFTQIMDTGLNKGNVILSEEYDIHVSSCPYCSKLVPLWKIKAGGGLLADAKQVIAGASRGSPEILHKRKGEIDIYFRPIKPGSNQGLMVRMKSGEEILSVDETSVEVFHAACEDSSEYEH
jgi:hypothetical protein